MTPAQLRYRNYLRSPEWAALRNQKRKKGRCGICASKQNLEVHHLFYRRNRGETDTSDLRLSTR